MHAAPTYGRMTAWPYGYIQYLVTGSMLRWAPGGMVARASGMYACAVQAGMRPRGLHARWLAAAATFCVLWKSSPIDVTSHATGGRSPGSSY